MIINDFDVFCESIQPMKADPPLIIGANAVLTGKTAFEHLKVIAGWNPQILKTISDFVLPECSTGELVSIRKWSFCPISVSNCGLACATYSSTSPRKPLFSSHRFAVTQSPLLRSGSPEALTLDKIPHFRS